MMDSRLDILRDGTRMYTVAPREGGSLEDSIGSSSTLSLEWSSPNFLDIEIGDYVVMGGRPYYFFTKPTEEMAHTNRYDYSAKLYGEEHMLDRTMCLFLDSSEGVAIKSQTDYQVNATPREILSLIVRNINRNVAEPWIYEVRALVKDGELIEMQSQNSTCKAVLDSLCDKVDGEWMFDPERHSLILADRNAIEGDKSLRLEYPESLLSPLKFSHNEDAVTRLFVAGGKRNITSDYADGESDRLLMRGKMKALEISSPVPAEGYYVNDDIYPRRNSHITHVRRTEKGFYFVTDRDIEFDINTHLVPGQTAKIAFLDGRLAGYEFEIATYDHSSKTIEIKQQTEGEAVMPNETMHPSIGDEYVLLDIRMPDQYVTEAEEELYEDAMKKFGEVKADKIKTDASVRARWLIMNRKDIRIFDIISVMYRGAWRSIRVTKVTRKPFDKETYGRGIDIELSDFRPTTALAALRKDVHGMDTRLRNTAAKQESHNETVDRDKNRIDDMLNWRYGDE